MGSLSLEDTLYAGILTLSSINIWCWILLCCVTVQGRMFSRIPGLYLPGTSSIPVLLLWQPKRTPECPFCHSGGKIALGWEPLLYIQMHSKWVTQENSWNWLRTLSEFKHRLKQFHRLDSHEATFCTTWRKQSLCGGREGKLPLWKCPCVRVLRYRKRAWQGVRGAWKDRMMTSAWWHERAKMLVSKGTHKSELFWLLLISSETWFKPQLHHRWAMWPWASHLTSWFPLLLLQNIGNVHFYLMVC